MRAMATGHPIEQPAPARSGMPPGGLFDRLAEALLAAVVICRLLTPTDAAAAGETLWIAQLSLLAFVVWALAVYRAGVLRLIFCRADAAVLLLCLGHGAGALFVMVTSGDKRAALNMFWEWCGVAVTYFLMRWLLRTAVEWRSLLLAVAAAAVSLSGLGIWQHYGGFTESQQKYAKLKAEMQSLEHSGRPADPRAALEWDRALNEIRATFVDMGVPSDKTAQMLWEERLKSTESIGLFALANTLGGVLAFAAVIWLGVLVYADRSLTRWPTAVGGVLTLVLLYCLLLTKSRTALVGLMAGLAVWAIGARSWRSAGRRRLGWGVSVGLVAAVSLITIAGATGGLDRFVLSESAKSLRYRFEYWRGTCHMLVDNPRNWLLGVGPGNFRQNYLPFKLPQSSEEIADPHNMLLDAWSNGGITAVFGLAGICAAGLRPLFESRSKEGTGSERPEVISEKSLVREAPVPGSRRAGDPSPARPADGAGVPTWRNGILAGGVMGHLAALVPGGAGDETIVLLLFGWLCVVSICRPLYRRDFPRVVCSAAFAALGVHLLGAGGIGMPGIVQLLLLMVALGGAVDRPGGWTFVTESRWPIAAIGLASLGIYFGSWFTGLIPVYGARAAIDAGEYALFHEGQAAKAERAFRRAAEADPWSSAPYERLSQLAYQSWLSSEGGNQQTFERSIAWQHEAIARNPRHTGGFRLLGEMYLGKFNRTKDAADAFEAAEAYRQAVTLYPNHAQSQSELAEALWKAGRAEPAQVAARRARELDAINEAAGHADKRLSTARRDLMIRILEER